MKFPAVCILLSIAFFTTAFTQTDELEDSGEDSRDNYYTNPSEYNSTFIISYPRNITIHAGQRAYFKCVIYWDPNLVLETVWLRNGEPFDTVYDPRFEENMWSFAISLKIFNTTTQDSGVYTCSAKTDYDEVSAQATLTVK